MRKTLLPASRTWRFTLVGAGTFGLGGFVLGIVLCLHYRIPIPPLFVTELSLLIGGCLGAALALATEGRPEPGNAYSSTEAHAEQWRSL